MSTKLGLWTRLSILGCVCVCVCMFSSVHLISSLWTIARQAPLFMGFPRQEYQSGLLFTTPGELADPGIKSVSLASPALAGRFFTTAPPGSL